jgi:hypothetical protein
VRIHEYGDPSVLKIEDIEVPPPASGEVGVLGATEPKTALRRSVF